jgi:hypothetical protein
MAWFIVRVELHNDPTWRDYDVLHKAMEAEGFSRTITADSGTVFHLPTAEYLLAGNSNRQQACDKAKRAAARTGKPFSVLVTESNGATWHNLDEVKRS